ncbi:aspartyl-phosphate phosphatase Spo0E family protein [Alkaliphilus sp. MSJ-5]|uniref:Aspartyl-phosphate phosphatase Spo0E family protein n=1 Tax=Alkaliphilus flagellatus TaxID=2841507 RepID=A0ABS6G6E4_9FIRM|nr:aspartyl-phosphate phosphatase Spo0E family protein [Alkaliphilus flagellatus]
MCNKTKLLELINEIEIVKVELHNLICKKQYNLTDSEVVKLSELLDQLLSQYHNIK